MLSNQIAENPFGSHAEKMLKNTYLRYKYTVVGNVKVRWFWAHYYKVL